MRACRALKTETARVRELEERLAEARDQQTATREILRVISGSPTDVAPVLAAVVASAARLCGAGDVAVLLVEGDDLASAESASEFPLARECAQRFGHRTMLAVPLLRGGEPMGVVSACRREVRPFGVAQIELLETFADQAVIALEHVRLFNETKEALERQTATSAGRRSSHSRTPRSRCSRPLPTRR